MDSDSDSSVASEDLSCSLTMPPVVTKAELQSYRNGRMETIADSDDSSEHSGDVNCRSSIPPAVVKSRLIPKPKEEKMEAENTVNAPQTEQHETTNKDVAPHTVSRTTSARTNSTSVNSSVNSSATHDSPKSIGMEDYDEDDEDNLNHSIALPLHLTPTKSNQQTLKMHDSFSSQDTNRHRNHLPSLASLDGSESSISHSQHSETSGASTKSKSKKKRQKKHPKSPSKSPHHHHHKSPGKVKKKVSKILATCLPGNDQIISFMEQHGELLAKYGVLLPTVVLVGEPGSGKSSLISHLCGVELPVSVATKCPIRLSLKRSKHRQATVSVEWQSHIVSNQYPEWQPVTVSDTLEIRDTILEAQNFILEQTRKDIAYDIVSIRVQGPEFLDHLTVVDLPALVGTGRDQDDDELNELCSRYLKSRDHVVVAVCSGDQPSTNRSAVVSTVQAEDPQNERSVFVVTKPDHYFDASGYETFLTSLSDRFCVVKCDDSPTVAKEDPIGTMHSDMEREFFQQTEPWMSMRDGIRFGIESLRVNIGETQVRLMKAKMPQLMEDLKKKRTSLATTLKELGDAPRNSTERKETFQQLINHVVENLKHALTGKGGTPGSSFTTSLHDDCAHFKERILEGSWGTLRKISEGGSVLVVSSFGIVIRGEVVHLDESFACVDFVDSIDRRSKVLFVASGLKSDEKIEENDVWINGDSIHIARKDNTYDTLRKIPLSSIRTDPSWLKERIQCQRNEDLSCFLSADLFKAIVSEYIDEEWRPHSLRLLELTHGSLQKATNDALTEGLTNDRYPKLGDFIATTCRESVQTLMDQTNARVASCLESEKHPFTQNDELFQAIAKGKTRAIKQELEVALQLDKQEIVDPVAVQAIIDSVFERNHRKSKEDLLAEELENVLSAYGEIATNRVVDCIPMACWDVFRSLPETIETALLRLDDSTLKSYIADSKYMSKHKNATDEIKDLDRALEALEALCL